MVQRNQVRFVGKMCKLGRSRPWLSGSRELELWVLVGMMIHPYLSTQESVRRGLGKCVTRIRGMGKDNLGAAIGNDCIRR